MVQAWVKHGSTSLGSGTHSVMEFIWWWNSLGSGAHLVVEPASWWCPLGSETCLVVELTRKCCSYFLMHGSCAQLADKPLGLQYGGQCSATMQARLVRIFVSDPPWSLSDGPFTDFGLVPLWLCGSVAVLPPGLLA